jgi:hypothetical protein
MRSLIEECAPWLNWKVAAVFAVAVVCIGFIVSADAELIAVAGATPLLAIAACLVPCLIPLVLLRGKKEPAKTVASTTSGCSCGSDACTIGTGNDSCQSRISPVGGHDKTHVDSPGGYRQEQRIREPEKTHLHSCGWR